MLRNEIEIGYRHPASYPAASHQGKNIRELKQAKGAQCTEL